MSWPPPRTTVAAVLSFLAVGLLVQTGGQAWLPAPYPKTAVPDMLGLAAGAAVGFAVLATSSTSRRRWATASGCAALAFVLTLSILWGIPRATESGNAHRWAPALAAIGAAVWAGGWLVERRVGRRLGLVTGLLLAFAFVGSGLSVAKEAHRTLSRGHHWRAWNVYHYYLGSKYFGELGYSQLYAATLAADDLVAPGLPEKARTLQHVRRTRDMHTYRLVSRAQAVAALDPDIDEALLRSLHADLRGILAPLSDEMWENVVGDLGYNPAPAWPVVGKPLALALDTRGTDRWILTNLDVPLFVASLLSVWWAWGPRMAAGMALFVCTVGFNRARLLGGFLAYDWLASLLIGMALWRKGWSASGGAVLSWGAMTRVFPGFLVFPGLVLVAHRLWTRRTLRTPTVRFVTAFTVACAVWFALSHTTGRGLHTWPEWVDAIRVHSTLHPYDGRARLGLPRLAAHEPMADHPWHAHPRTVELEAARALHRRARPWQLGGVLLVVLAAIRRHPFQRALWMLALVWVAVTTSRYYGSSWALLMALGLPDEGDAGHEQSPAGVLAAAGVLLVPAIFYAGDSHEEIYFMVNYWVGFLLFAVAVLWLLQDARELRAGSNGDPESP